MAASNFAREQLEKHGWKEGSGLGRHEHGRPDPIKVKLKMDTAGVGHNLSDQFTFNWWEHAFNKAANNITVESSESGVSVKKTTDQELKLSTSESVMTGKYDSKAMLYGSFVKGATLTNGILDDKEDDSQSDDSSDEEDRDSVSKLTDEELFKACGGRTAHKAARHGHKLNGKLQRIQEQERELLKKYLAKKESRTAYQEEDTSSSSSNLSTNQGDSNIQVKPSSSECEEVKERGEKKKKKRKKDREVSTDDKKLKKKKKEENKEGMVDLENDEPCTTACENSNRRKSSKKRKRKDRNDESDPVVIADDVESEKKAKKIKKKKKAKKLRVGGLD
ncbi:G patch domain-containing protein 4-like isoform X2 [Branchiostoma floridae x Branchiostoma japonicum]